MAGFFAFVAPDPPLQDAFGPSTGYPDGALVDGIPLRDQVVFERDLAVD